MSGILVREQGEQNQIIGLKLEIEKIMQLIFSNSDDTYIIHRMGEDILFFDKKEKTLIAIQVKASEKVKTGYVNISEIKRNIVCFFKNLKTDFSKFSDYNLWNISWEFFTNRKGISLGDRTNFVNYPEKLDNLTDNFKNKFLNKINDESFYLKFEDIKDLYFNIVNKPIRNIELENFSLIKNYYLTKEKLSLDIDSLEEIHICLNKVLSGRLLYSDIKILEKSIEDISTNSNSINIETFNQVIKYFNYSDYSLDAIYDSYILLVDSFNIIKNNNLKIALSTIRNCYNDKKSLLELIESLIKIIITTNKFFNLNDLIIKLDLKNYKGIGIINEKINDLYIILYGYLEKQLLILDKKIVALIILLFIVGSE